jgi:integrase
VTARYLEEKGRWYVDFIFAHADGTKERVRKPSPVNTRKGAEEYERQARLALQAQGGPSPKAAMPTFTEYAERFMVYAKNNCKKPGYIAKESILKHHLNPCFGAKRLDTITLDEIEAFKLSRLERGLSKKTVNNHLIDLNAILHRAHDTGVLSKRVTAEFFPLPKPEDLDFVFLTFEEADALVAAAPNEMARALILLALDTGLRDGELRALKRTSLDLEVGRLVVRERIHDASGMDEDSPKSGRNRELALSQEARKALLTIRHLRGPYVFCREDGKPLSRQNVETWLEKAVKASGIQKHVTWHVLRHTFASHVAKLRGNLFEVQSLLGHSTVQMTRRYAHLLPEVQSEIAAALDRRREAAR